MKSICCYSSLLFITNAILSYLYKDYIYTFLFIYLTISSVIHHSNKTLYTYIFDKIAVISVVIYGFIQFKKKINISKNKKGVGVFETKRVINYTISFKNWFF